MQFIQGNNRHQTYFTTPDDQVGADNAVRLMDAFIDKLDLQQLGFTGTGHKSEGRPPYAPGEEVQGYQRTLATRHPCANKGLLYVKQNCCCN